MHRLPLDHHLYMPLSPITTTTITLLQPLPVELTSLPSISLVNGGLLSNSYSFYATTNFEPRPLSSLVSSVPHGCKRRRYGAFESQPRKRVKLESVQPSPVPCVDDSSPLLTKNALMLLHDLKPSVEYKLVSQTGPSHRPIFTMSVEVNGQAFEGMAQTKKEAKQAAAEKALRSFAELPSAFFEETTDKSKTHSTSMAKSTLEESLNLICQLKPEARFESTVNDLPSEFEVTLIIDEQQFIGTGGDEAVAKTRAIQLALEKVLGIQAHIQSIVLSRRSPRTVLATYTSNLPANDVDGDFLSQSHADHIAQCIYKKFQQLTETDAHLQRRKVLAGVALTRHMKLDSMEIIAITTGSRALQNDDSKLNGHALRDCHAEVLARRCLLRYCYEQLQLCLDEKSEQSIFEPIDHTHRFRLRQSIAFHLFISMAPCGDSRLFSLQAPIVDPSSMINLDSRHLLRRSRGVLRRKIDGAEGTLPAFSDLEGHTVHPGEQLANISCSDKLCRWNCIGLQGALLSLLIDPIYYGSIIVGSLYHRDSIERALFRRIEQSVKDLPAPYRCKSPSIYSTSNVDARTTTRAPFHALIWNCVDGQCELIDTYTGLTPSHTRSTVSKLALFEQWSLLMKRLGTTTPSALYSDAKQLAIDYQQAKLQVHQAFQINGLGRWNIRANEHDRFDFSSLKVALAVSSD